MSFGTWGGHEISSVPYTVPYKRTTLPTGSSAVVRRNRKFPSMRRLNQGHYMWETYNIHPHPWKITKHPNDARYIHHKSPPKHFVKYNKHTVTKKKSHILQYAGLAALAYKVFV